MTVYVLGSLNIDLVSTVERMPNPGETVSGTSFKTYIGGKGLNQAVGCSRAGAKVVMLGAVGDDGYGKELMDALAADSISDKYISHKKGASGVAVIETDVTGQNRIVVIPGANGQLTPADIPDEVFKDSSAKYLKILGCNVLRFNNEELEKSLEKVLLKIKKFVIFPSP